MKDDKLIAALEEVAGMVGARVSYEVIKKTTGRQPKGGLCYIAEGPRIIIHKKLSDSEKVQVLIDALHEFDLDNLYIAPEVRQAIEGVTNLIK
jgi:hypothetical protein